MTHPSKGKRVSRACISCRSRKTRCDLDSTGSPGIPPCRRCIEEQRECVLATSRRGGRRVRKKKPLEGEDDNSPLDTQASTAGAEGGGTTSARPSLDGWPPAVPPAAQDSSWVDESAASRTDASRSASRRSSVALEGHLASNDLLNPSDALDLLAQVADLDPSRQAKRTDNPAHSNGIAAAQAAPMRYPPISSGALGYASANTLVQYYHQNYHPFFPVAHRSIFEGHVGEWIEKEEHLLTAILIVASKDDPSWQIPHEACSKHMESLISRLIYGSEATVGAVEALLILAEWAPQPPHEISSFGCGKEDYGAWMLVGVAIRLGYLQRLEQTGLQEGEDALSDTFTRKRIAWAACYMSDRQVSIRLGKGFWSRGPGPSTNLRAANFPSLQSQNLGPDNLGILFQAQLELTQLFSNAHDILYSSTSHREQLYVGGEYVRYIDDFASVLRNWKMNWGNFSFTPQVKASLILSYDFLRLYINAFAFQATINRAAAKSRKSSIKTPLGPLFADLAAAPDARFIYESIDAANSLLSVLNSFIDPVAGLKYMPLKYPLFVIYAATFLFKAWLAGAINSDAISGVRRAILGTINQLQKTSTSTQSIGHRYARSLRLLWRKRSGKQRSHQKTENEATGGPSHGGMQVGQGGHQTHSVSQTTPESIMAGGVQLDALNGFSWRDLDSLGQYISNEASMYAPDGVLTTSDFDSEHGNSSIEGMPVDFAYQNTWQGGDIIF